jgi:small-conductance mechanosensitive channel
MTETRVIAVEKDWKQQVQSLEESSRKDREGLEATHREALKMAVEDAEQTMASLQRANSLRMEHEQALAHLQKQLEHDKSSCQATHETVESLQEEVNKIVSEKNQLQQYLKLLKQDKQRLQQSLTELTHNMDEFMKKWDVQTKRNLNNSRDLLFANDRLRDLDNKRFHINMELIWTDAKAILKRVGRFRFHYNILEWTFPFCEFAMQVLSGIWSGNAALIDEWHKVHVQPILETRIYLIQRYLVEFRGKVLEGLADSIQYQSGSILSYVRSLKGESKSRSALLGAFEYSKSQSDKVARILERTLCIFAAFWMIVGLFAWRNHRSKRLPGAKVRKMQSDVKAKVD